MSHQFNYENSYKNTITNAFNIRNKHLSSSIFISDNEKKENDYTENEDFNDVKTNISIFNSSDINNNIVELHNLKDDIEKMSKFHQIEILRILTKSKNVYLNENSNGTFVNLSQQSDEVINELKKYVKYVSEQQRQLSVIENERSRLEKIFNKDNKDK